MDHDLEQGLVRLTEAEQKLLAERYAIVDERAVHFMLDNARYSSGMLSRFVGGRRRAVELGLEEPTDNFEQSTSALEADIVGYVDAIGQLELIATNVDFKWRNPDDWDA